MQDRQEGQYTKDPIFNSICSLAIAGDEKGLRQLLATNVSIARHFNWSTPVKLLAQNGEHRAVQFLLRRFHANPNHAVEGYARGGFVENVNALLKLGAKNIDAACGYAYAGNHCQLEPFLKEDSFIPGHYMFDLNVIILDAAMGGQFELVEQLITMGAGIKEAAWGYVIGGYDHKVEDLRRRDGSINTTLLDAYAITGNVSEVENYLQQDEEVLPIAVDAYAQGGHVNLVEDLLSRGANLLNAIKGYIKGGFIHEADELIARALGNQRSLHASIIHTYACHYMLDNLKTQVQSDADFHVIVWALDQSDVMTDQEICSPSYFALKTLVTLMSFPYSQENTFIEYAGNNPDLSSGALYESMLKVRSIYKIMQEYSLDFEQAYALHNNYTPLIIWILQGKNIEPPLPHNIFIKLAMQLTKLDYLDTEAICTAVVKNTHDGAKARIEQKYRPGFFDCITRACRDTHREMKQKHDELSELESKYDQGRRIKSG